MQEKFKNFLYDELDKIKISKGERENLIEEFIEWQWESDEEDFIKKYGRAPKEKEAKEIIKKYVAENAIQQEEHKRQVEKERGQLQCLINALKWEKQRLTLEEMSNLLKRSGYSVGSSVKTIYRRILEEFPKYNIKKGSDGKYYYDNSYEEQENNKLTSYTADATANFSRVLFMGAPEANLKNETWNTIYKAMQTNSPLVIYYTSEGKKESAVYGIRPYQLIFDNGCWELWAECLKQKHEGLRLFNLSRISNIRIQEETHFELPSDYNFMNKVTGSFGCYIDENQKLYKIKFDKGSYAWLYSKDRIWGDKQTVEEKEDGFILSFEANQFKPILRWVLGWGDEVEPLEPKELVAEWTRKIKNMASRINS